MQFLSICATKRPQDGSQFSEKPNRDAECHCRGGGLQDNFSYARLDALRAQLLQLDNQLVEVLANR